MAAVIKRSKSKQTISFNISLAFSLTTQTLLLLALCVSVCYCGCKDSSTVYGMIGYREPNPRVRAMNNDWDMFINNTSTDRVNFPNIVLVTRWLNSTNTYYRYFDLAKDVDFYTDNPECPFLGKLVFYSSETYTTTSTPTNSY